jgi:hypothetical protein
MKKVLVVVFAVVLGVFAVQASAQLPNVGVYFHHDGWGGYSQMAADCPAAPAGTVVDQAYVVANNFNMWVVGIEYMIEYPVEVTWNADIIVSGQLKIGQSPTGIAITWQLPQNGFAQLLCQEVLFTWMCEEGYCGPDPMPNNIPWVVVPSPYSVSGQVQAVRWPDNGLVTGVGLTSLICPWTIPTEETTWGGIKAMYK